MSDQDAEKPSEAPPPKPDKQETAPPEQGKVPRRPAEMDSFHGSDEQKSRRRT